MTYDPILHYECAATCCADRPPTHRDLAVKEPDPSVADVRMTNSLDPGSENRFAVIEDRNAVFGSLEFLLRQLRIPWARR
ncbi:hypothetical protein ANCDUO_14263 [Ancylostoma duodenale]|uniref:Uncharacterized protein n=1 Tax=Ancylostoma duodenale TaxID=51022 RepID=A0A0C2G9L9_9BILA|nr:hypothetical protein ANCDUO_14263 [Ancylostoma duodenale]